MQYSSKYSGYKFVLMYCVESVRMRTFSGLWFVFSQIPTEYGDLPCKPPYFVKMCEKREHKNSEYGHFLQGESVLFQENVN